MRKALLSDSPINPDYPNPRIPFPPNFRTRCNNPNHNNHDSPNSPDSHDNPIELRSISGIQWDLTLLPPELIEELKVKLSEYKINPSRPDSPDSPEGKCHRPGIYSSSSSSSDSDSSTSFSLTLSLSFSRSVCVCVCV